MKWKYVPILIGIIAVAAAIGASAFFIHTLVLRTDYKNTALQINEKILENIGQAKIRLGKEEADASSQLLDFYDKFLLDPNTGVYSRKDADSSEITEERIIIQLGENELSFGKLEDGSAILVSWKTADTKKQFRVRSMTSFMQLHAYCENYLKRS